MKPTPKAMTPSAAYPYFDAKPMQFRGVKVRATPAVRLSCCSSEGTFGDMQSYNLKAGMQAHPCLQSTPILTSFTALQEGSPYPKAYSPKVQNPQQPFGRAPVQELTGTGPPPPRAKGKEPARALPDPAQVPLHLHVACDTADSVIPAPPAAQKPLHLPPQSPYPVQTPSRMC